ncbi:MAG TPA: type II toxin-antitoxin system Phd/YefM family antitoxin [Thermoanaerobaculia bacterium]
MRTIPAAKFKAGCLKIMDEVKTSREAVLITKKGKPVARLVPVEEAPRDVFGCLAGDLEITGDVTAPVVPASAWRASR